MALVALLAGACGKQPAGTSSAAVLPGPADSAQGGSGLGGGGDLGDPGDDEGTSGSGEGPGREPAEEFCPTWAAPVKAGTMPGGKLDEISGLAASRAHKGVLWAHNDSGEKKARVYAIGSDGRHLATFKLKGIQPRDWEDIAVGPCAATGPLASSSCIYVGDTGDNDHSRKIAWIHRVPEPVDLPAAPTGQAPPKERFRKADTESFVVRYPDAPQLSGKARDHLEHPDVEALAVLPDTRVLLFTKRKGGTTDVFRLALHQPEATVERLGALGLGDPQTDRGHALAVTGADLTANGRWLAIRCYFRIYVFDAGEALLAAATEAPTALAELSRATVHGGLDIQGESIAWDPDGGLWHTSEGKHQPLWHIPCGTR